MWKITLIGTAEKQFNKKYVRSPDFVRFKNALHELEQAEDPTSLGTLKKVGNLRCYSYDVTNALRMLYTVDKENNLIIIHRLGDHKEVYGKD